MFHWCGVPNLRGALPGLGTIFSEFSLSVSFLGDARNIGSSTPLCLAMSSRYIVARLTIVSP